MGYGRYSTIRQYRAKTPFLATSSRRGVSSPDDTATGGSVFRISRFAHARSNQPAHADMSLEDLSAALSTPAAHGGGEKLRTPMWSPASFDGPRSNANAIEICAAVLDYDDGTTPEAAVIPWAGFHLILHTSWNHTPDHPRFRLILPLAAPVPAAQWSAAWSWVAARAVGSPDGQCKDPARAYFVPALRPGAWGRVIAGRLLEVPEDLPLPPEVRRAPEGWAPPEAPGETLAPEVLARAIRRWRERLAASVASIASLKDGRRAAIQRAAYWLAGHVWLDRALARELQGALVDAARACDRETRDSLRLIDDTIIAGSDNPIPLEDLVSTAELSTMGVAPAPPLVIKYRSAYWVRGSDSPPWTYDGPHDGDGLVVALRDRGDVAYLGATGAPWSRARLLDCYGTNALGAELVYPSPEGMMAAPWDPVSRTFRTTRAVTPAVTPRLVPEVAAWLDALLSEAPEAIASAALDWLATLDRLDAPSAALYLEGPPGCGKSLLASALASPWRTPPVPLEVAIGDYPLPLARCPIVWLDEGTALDARGTARFRTLVSERSHTLNEKYLPSITLSACLRVVITANNADALGIREIRSLADLDAIAERVLHVRGSQAATDYLRRTSTAGWVTAPDGGPGLIAAHLAHLRAARPVAPGPRWVVAGVRSAFHDGLIWHVPEYAAVLGAILVGLAARPKPRFARSGDTVEVAASVLHKEWASLCLEDRARPTHPQLVRTLSALSRTPGEAGVWRVDAAAVDAYARAIGS